MLGIHPFHILVDEFTVLCQTQLGIVIDRRNNKLIAQLQLFPELLQGGMLQCLFHSYPSGRTKLQHPQNQFHQLPIATTKVLLY